MTFRVYWESCYPSPSYEGSIDVNADDSEEATSRAIRRIKSDLVGLAIRIVCVEEVASA